MLQEGIAMKTLITIDHLIQAFLICKTRLDSEVLIETPISQYSPFADIADAVVPYITSENIGSNFKGKIDILCNFF